MISFKVLTFWWLSSDDCVCEQINLQLKYSMVNAEILLLRASVVSHHQNHFLRNLHQSWVLWCKANAVIHKIANETKMRDVPQKPFIKSLLL